MLFGWGRQGKWQFASDNGCQVTRFSSCTNCTVLEQRVDGDATAWQAIRVAGFTSSCCRDAHGKGSAANCEKQSTHMSGDAHGGARTGVCSRTIAYTSFSRVQIMEREHSSSLREKAVQRPARPSRAPPLVTPYSYASNSAVRWIGSVSVHAKREHLS